MYKIRSEVCWCVANCGINFGEFAVDRSSVVTTKQWLGLKGQSFSLSQWFSKFVTGLLQSPVKSCFPEILCVVFASDEVFVCKDGGYVNISRAVFRRGRRMGSWEPFRTW